MVIAEVTYDHLEKRERNKQFHYLALANWWGTDIEATEIDLENSPKISFRLYDDDGIEYYSGWLLNDDFGYTQQFVLAWAESDSGCTTIKVKDIDGWQQQIG